MSITLMETNKASFLKEADGEAELSLLDASYHPDSHMLVEVYYCNNYINSSCGIIYVLDHGQGNEDEYSVFACLDDLMQYILDGNIEAKFCELNKKEYELFAEGG